MDIIEQALAEAQRELDKNKGQDFNDKYKVSKLVGHGAFAKVSSITGQRTDVPAGRRVR